MDPPLCGVEFSAHSLAKFRNKTSGNFVIKMSKYAKIHNAFVQARTQRKGNMGECPQSRWENAEKRAPKYVIFLKMFYSPLDRVTVYHHSLGTIPSILLLDICVVRQN